MTLVRFMITAIITLGLGALVSGWTVTKCSSCGHELIRRFYGISPLLRISPAVIIGLFGWLSYTSLISEKLGFLKTSIIILLGITAITFVVMTRRAYIRKNFRTCTQCGRKPGFGFRQLL